MIAANPPPAASAPALASTERVATIRAGAATRDAALDFAKGALVLCMVAHHALNYFRYDINYLRHLHFVPSSFIFIAGFLVTHVYLPRTRAGDPGVYRRLFVRGLKLLALFLALNVAVHALVRTTYNRHLDLGLLVENLDAVFVTGDERATVFGVLLPIGYLLLLSSVLLRAVRAAPLAFHVVVAVTCLACAALAQRGLLSFNLELLSMGLLGMAIGFASRSRLKQLAAPLPAIAAAGVIYVLLVREWYPTYLLNALGVALWLLLFYSAGRRVAAEGALARNIALLGNYSLPAYLVQIGVLQALYRTTRGVAALAGNVVAAFVATAVLTLLIVRVVDFARARRTAIDRGYRAVFA